MSLDKSKTKVAVIGLGYVGLPLACLAARRGYNVIGVDKKKQIVELTNKGKSHIKDDYLQNSLNKTQGRLKATTDFSLTKDCNIFIICVPTPVLENKEPDFQPLISSANDIAPYIKKNDLIVVESTVFPGTCEEYVLPILEKKSGLTKNEFYFSHCPERVNPGDAFWTVENIPRVVGGLNEKATELTAEFYQSLLLGAVYKVEDVKKVLRPKFSMNKDGSYNVKMMPLGSITKMNSLRDAEAVKVMENAVRDVNIAFVNELAKISDVLDLDVLDIVEGMSTKPFGKGPFYPGIGVGGHCIAVDPEWLKSASIKKGFFPKMIQISRDTNNSMPHYAVSLLEKELGSLENKKIAVLGVTYKGNIDDPRESPFYDVKKILLEKKAKINVFDPWFEKENNVNSINDALKETEAIILVTDHDIFKNEIKAELLKKYNIKIVIDGRNCLDKKDILNNNIKYKGIGRK
ncbi:MAG: nucleotide sugar dehydrogenase [Candidatus Woesearchaeota archaeon]